MGQWVDAAKQIKEPDAQVLAIAQFPHSYNKEGRCEHLAADHSCNIYETRPDICSIKKNYEQFYFNTQTRKEFYKNSEQACLTLQDQLHYKPLKQG